MKNSSVKICIIYKNGYRDINEQILLLEAIIYHNFGRESRLSRAARQLLNLSVQAGDPAKTLDIVPVLRPLDDMLLILFSLPPLLALPKSFGVAALI